MTPFPPAKTLAVLARQAAVMWAIAKDPNKSTEQVIAETAQRLGRA